MQLLIFYIIYRNGVSDTFFQCKFAVLVNFPFVIRTVSQTAGSADTSTYTSHAFDKVFRQHVLGGFQQGDAAGFNSIAGNLKAAFGVPEAVTGAVLAAVSAVILLGGLKRVAAVAERLVPAMALLYIEGALTVVGVHITAVPAALAAIVKGAFGLRAAGGRAAGGGRVGYGLARAVTWCF